VPPHLCPVISNGVEQNFAVEDTCHRIQLRLAIAWIQYAF
jgi:hypothetical protein